MSYAFKQCKTNFQRLANPALQDVFAQGLAAFYIPDLAAGAVNILGAKAGNGATRSWTAGITSPVHPRNVQVVFAASYDGGNVTLTGFDQFGRAQTETITAQAATTVEGTKVWKTITQVALPSTPGANAATFTLNTGATATTLIGLPVPLLGAWGQGFHDGVAELMTFNATVHAFTPTTNPNGSVDFLVLVPVDWKKYQKMIVSDMADA